MKFEEELLFPQMKYDGEDENRIRREMEETEEEVMKDSSFLRKDEKRTKEAADNESAEDRE
jgi:hypothetical protein